MNKNISGFPSGIHNIIPNTKYNILEIANFIKVDDALKNTTMELRSATSKKVLDLIKTTNLPYVTFGGIFAKRTDKELIIASGFVCIDIDKISQEQIELYRQQLQISKTVLLLFVSPSGQGLKVICKTNQAKSYKENYIAYTKWLIRVIGVKEENIDSSCASISKACFICHDPKVYLHPEIKVQEDIDKFPTIDHEYFSEEEITSTGELYDSDLEIEQNAINYNSFLHYPIKLNYSKRNSKDNFISLCILNTRNNGELATGRRHIWCFNLALLCNGFGLEKEIAVKYFWEQFSAHPAIIDKINKFDKENDLLKPFEHAYNNNQEHFKSWKENETEKEYETPLIPDEIFENLPHSIKKLTDIFKEKRERDVFFLGYLTLLSTFFPKVQGIYDQRRYKMNLFLFVSAPAASGKGVLNFVRMCGEKIHQDFIEKYKDELRSYNDMDEKDKKSALPPVLKKLFIPANNTSSKIIITIRDNDIFGIVLDTEADTIKNADKSEHGHFTTIFRQAFQHEVIELERKGNNEYILIKNPAISVLISGTPDQVNNLIKDIENGLFSRFIFYDFKTKAEFKDVFEQVDDFEHKFKSVSNELLLLVKPYFQDYINDPSSNIIFSFSKHQQLDYREWFTEKFKTLDHIYGSDFHGSVKRLGLIYFRIAMTLTVMRNLEENGILNEKLTCSDQDYFNTQKIIGTIIFHNTKIFNQLRAKMKFKKFVKSKDLYLNKLPNEFNRQDAMEIAKLMQINEKTAENYLAGFVSDGKLIKPKHNCYKKDIE